MTPSMLLKSWATPPARREIVSIFCDWASWACSLSFSTWAWIWAVRFRMNRRKPRVSSTVILTVLTSQGVSPAAPRMTTSKDVDAVVSTSSSRSLIRCRL